MPRCWQLGRLESGGQTLPQLGVQSQLQEGSTLHGFLYIYVYFSLIGFHADQPGGKQDWASPVISVCTKHSALLLVGRGDEKLWQLCCYLSTGFGSS